jgi:hypothetical protein
LFFAQWLDFYERVRADGSKWIQHKEVSQAQQALRVVALVYNFEVVAIRTRRGEARPTETVRNVVVYA